MIDQSSDYVHAAWPVASVRRAEEQLLARSGQDELMQRAAWGLARSCAQVLQTQRGGVYGSKVVLLVGRGNNGGDALYAGAILARRGAHVVAIVAAPDASSAHRAGVKALRTAGAMVQAVDQVAVAGVLASSDLIVDGLVGIGSRGALREPAAGLVETANRIRQEQGVPIAAVDLPSGVDADTGEILGVAIAADVTVTFGCQKPGLLLSPGFEQVGRLELVDIALTTQLDDPPALRCATHGLAKRAWPPMRSDDDKYRRGVVGVAAGSATYPGAALLTVGGALAGPAGMVRFAGPAADGVVQRYPEVVVVADIASMGRVQAWVVGPGLGTDDVANQTLAKVLESQLPAVVDGDALTLFALALTADRAQRFLSKDAARLVFTPHSREFARLCEALETARLVPASHLATVSPLVRVQSVADALGATVLLKGHRTIVASPGQVPVVNSTGTPTLATAGSGDVLAGLIGALLAGGADPHDAAATAAYVHGLAGHHAADRGVTTASSLVEAISQVAGGFSRSADHLT